jgi:hypothetical protein
MKLFLAKKPRFFGNGALFVLQKEEASTQKEADSCFAEKYETPPSCIIFKNGPKA